MTHGGKEYGYVTSGTLGVRVGFEEYELGPGGSIAFDSSSPHRLWTSATSRSTPSGSSSAARRTRGRRSVAPARGGVARLSLRALRPRLSGAGRRPPGSCGSERAARGLVEDEREQDQHADRHLRVLRRLVEQREDVVDQREEERRQQRTHERSASSGEARSAEDGAAMLSSAKSADERRADLDLGREVEAGNRRHHRAGDEGEEHHAAGRHPEPARRTSRRGRPPSAPGPCACGTATDRRATARPTTPMKAIGTKPTLVVQTRR